MCTPKTVENHVQPCLKPSPAPWAFWPARPTNTCCPSRVSFHAGTAHQQCASPLFKSKMLTMSMSCIQLKAFGHCTWEWHDGNQCNHIMRTHLYDFKMPQLEHSNIACSGRPLVSFCHTRLNIKTPQQSFWPRGFIIHLLLQSLGHWWCTLTHEVSTHKWSTSLLTTQLSLSNLWWHAQWHDHLLGHLSTLRTTSWGHTKVPRVCWQPELKNFIDVICSRFRSNRVKMY